MHHDIGSGSLGCTGFRWGGLPLLRDSTGEDRLQECAVCVEAAGVQVESLTVSWVEASELAERLKEPSEVPTPEIQREWAILPPGRSRSLTGAGGSTLSWGRGS